MACNGCNHDDHAPDPCPTCASEGTACWTGISVTGGDGDRTATGKIELASGAEPHPCMMCRSYEGDKKRLITHLLANKLQADKNGNFITPIAKDFAGRKSLKINPDNFGFCRRFSHPVDMLATCPDWVQVRTNAELATRIR